MMKFIFIKTVTMSAIKVKLFALLFLMGAGINVQKTIEKQRVDKVGTIIEQTTNEDCLELLMTAWFDEFNANQANGESMIEADKHARGKAVEVYEKYCIVDG